MTYRFGPIAGSLGCIAFLVVACGGSSFEGTDGTSGAASGGESAAGSGGKASAGSTSGGSASAGKASGGSSSGGSSSGGSANGGSASGGVTHGGTGSGGTSSGGTSGDPLACKEDADCVACAYPTAPQTKAQCYCASCAGTPLSKTACTANKAAWEKSCAASPLPCPAIACIEPPVPQCKSNICVASK
jgi:hypothetical protein